MGSTPRPGAAALAACVAILLVGCGRSAPPTEGSGFRLSAAQIDPPPSELAGHPDPDEWLVETAWVKPEVERILVRRDLPEGLEPELAPTSPAAPAANLALSPLDSGLTPIPSPGLSWGSEATDEGWAFDNPTVIGSPLVFLITENRGEWLRVMFPARPNQQQGWIEADQVTIKRHTWHITVDVTNNHLEVWQGDEVVFETGTVDGSPGTPTPLGRFYINEIQQVYPASPYGSFIFSTNGFSDTLERFGGEVPIFAIHGTANTASLGSDISNGCIRIPNEIIEQMAEMVPPGTPVDVVA